MSNATGGLSTQQTILYILAAKYHAKSQRAIQITSIQLPAGSIFLRQQSEE